MSVIQTLTTFTSKFDELMISHLNDLWDIIVVNALAVFDVVIVVIADFARYKVTQ